MTTQPRKPDLFDFNDFRAYLADWYHSVIRTLLGIIDLANDYAALGRLLQPAITTHQARVLAYANYIF